MLIYCLKFKAPLLYLNQLFYPAGIPFDIPDWELSSNIAFLQSANLTVRGWKM